jgi:hypothetical protein
VSPRVTLYTKPGCHLCEDARAVVERVCAELGEGRQHDFWRVDADRLRAALG